jgi:hypothetical protein
MKLLACRPSRRRFLASAGIALLAPSVSVLPAIADGGRDYADEVARGEGFLAGLLDPALDLLPEVAGSNTYWLFHDNYLAAKVLGRSHPKTAAKIRAAIKHYGIARSGKIEILFHENPHPLPLRRYELKEIARIGSKVVKTEVSTDRVFTEFRIYADLLLFAVMAETDQTQARAYFDSAMQMWDGRGFRDAAAKSGDPREPVKYATYKLALALLATKKLGLNPSQRKKIIERLLRQQTGAGGWTTDYDAALRPSGRANVETTSLAILALS